jgi:HlyD family secretion protein
MKSKKGVYILIGIFAVLLIIAIVKGKGSGKGIEVTAEKVERRTIVETVAASGKIQAETEVVISSDVSGEIIYLGVEEGDQVKKGDILIKIDPDLVESALSRAEASLNTAKANLSGSRARLSQAEATFENAKATYERNQQLFKDKVISQAEFDQAKANYEVALSDVDAAEESVNAALFSVKSSEATLTEAQENLGRTSIYSPIDGTITKLNKETGERVVGTAQMAGTDILTVADLNVMEVAVEVNENDIVRVSIGDTAEIEVDAYLDYEFKGVVTEIANSANVEGMSADQVTNFDVKIRMLKSSYESLLEGDREQNSPFRPGMSATVDIRTMVAKDVISVPIQAVTTRSDSLKEKSRRQEDEILDDDEKQTCLFVVDGDKAKLVYVETGIQNTMHIEIKSELDTSMQVIISPYSAVSRKLRDGKAIQILSEEELFSKKDD